MGCSPSRAAGGARSRAAPAPADAACAAGGAASTGRAARSIGGGEGIAGGCGGAAFSSAGRGGVGAVPLPARSSITASRAPTGSVWPSVATILAITARRRRRNFGVHLVGRDLDQRLILLDAFALLEPATWRRCPRPRSRPSGASSRRPPFAPSVGGQGTNRGYDLVGVGQDEFLKRRAEGVMRISHREPPHRPVEMLEGVFAR